ncbi:hypothetical protein C8Q78DRAFT_497996 [Trametes maxima]|nr:hypothetical protein C8Q78DRAFT_497996 [Trametes maxima]
MIVAPCQRCTSSITANNRATNGHRFVFYSSEITAGERHYVPGERGVSPFHHPPASASASVQAVQTSMAGMYVSLPARQFVPPLPSPARPSNPAPSSPTSSVPSSMPSLVSSPAIQQTARTDRRTSVDYAAPPSTGVDGTTTPGPGSPVSPGSLSPSALAARSRAASVSFQALASTAQQHQQQSTTVPPAPPNSHSASPYAASVSTFADAPASPARARAASTSAALSPSFAAYRSSGGGGGPPGYFATRVQQQPQPPQQPQIQQQQQSQAAELLQAGEVLYWHHLTRSGEIPAVAEDARARMGAEAQERARGRRDAKDAKSVEARERTRGGSRRAGAGVGVGGRGVFAGR